MPNFSVKSHRGLSPRGRGKRQAAGLPGNNGGSIPAWAGETTAGANPVIRGEVYPRVGGGNSNSGIKTSTLRGLSPRGRGKPAQ